jgi:hypothetical protein
VSTPQPDDDTEAGLVFTDVVLLLYLDQLPQHDNEDGPHYDNQPLRRAADSVFSLGCAVGVEQPKLIKPILEQTHPGESAAIIADCASTLTEQVASARKAGATLEPELFLKPLLVELDQEPHVVSEAANNVLSISFEYGCVLASVQPKAAKLVRNDFNRRQAQLLRALEQDDTGDVPLGPDPHQPLQETARELVSAYQEDIGFE